MSVIFIKITNNNIRNTHKNIYNDLGMKRKLFIFGGFGFIGLNLCNFLSKNYNISLIGKNNRNHKPKDCKELLRIFIILIF